MSDDLVRRVADEMEIRNLVANLAFCMDLAEDPEEYLSLLLEDAKLEVKEDPAAPPEMARTVVGHAALLHEWNERRRHGHSGPGSHKFHTVLTTTVKLDGDRARARSYMVFLRECQTRPDVAMFKIYQDDVVRTADGWKLAHRTAYPG